MMRLGIRLTRWIARNRPPFRGKRKRRTRDAWPVPEGDLPYRTNRRYRPWTIWDTDRPRPYKPINAFWSADRARWASAMLRTRRKGRA